MRIALRCAAAVVLLALLEPGLTARSSAQEPHDPLFERAWRDGSVRVIVRLAAAPLLPGDLATPAHVQVHRAAIVSARRIVKSALRTFMHRVVREYDSLPLVALDVGPDALLMLRTLPGVVLAIEEDRVSRPALTDTTVLIGATTAWSEGFDGTGQVVAILDTGVDKAHPFLSGKVVGEACFGSNGTSVVSLCPGGATSSTAVGSATPCASIALCEHGTMVAGIAAGTGATFSGVAKGAQIFAIKIFSRFNSSADCTGSPAPCLLSYVSDQIAALDHVFNLRASHNFAAVNLSLAGEGHASPCDDDPRKVAIDSLRAVGIATVVSAGNDGFVNAIASPACISTAISVSATTKSDNLAVSSNVAPFLTLLAPGASILTSVPGGGFAEGFGTSFAAPHVAGALAILREAQPDATVSDMVTALSTTGQPIDFNGLAFPRVQVDHALDRLTAPPVIEFASPGYAVAENGVAVVDVVRTGRLSAVSTVRYATANGSAIASVDYRATSGILTFSAGDAAKTITIPLIDDAVIEADKTLRVTLSSPTNAVLGPPSVTFVTIASNDVAGVVELGAAAYSASEGAGSVTVTVVRSGGSASGVTVQYATSNGTATAPAHYAARSGTLTFGGGESSRDLVIPLVDNTVVNGDRTFTVTLSAPAGGASLGARTAALVTIVDDDVAGTVQFGQPAFSVIESAGVATITVTRTGGAASGVTVQYATVPAGSATASVDYTARTGTLTFAAGVAAQTFTIPITSDLLFEGNETVNLALSAPGGATLGSPATAVLTIVDDDAPVISFGAATYTVAEGATATLTVTRARSLGLAVAVSYAATGGTATNGAVDYALTPGTLSFGPGETSKTIRVPTTQDTLAEGNETVVVSLSNPTGGAVLGTRPATTLTIVDNDHGGVIQFGATTYSVGEGGTATVAVTRTGSNLASGVTVRLRSTGGTATPGVDYAAVNQLLTFDAGVTSVSVPIETFDDTVPQEGAETVELSLSDVTGGATLGVQTMATLTIVDNDQAVSFAAATYAVAEGAGSVTITVRRTGPTVGTVKVHYATAAGTATPGTDYYDVSGDLTFTPGQTSKTFTVKVVANTVVDGARTVLVTLSSPGPGVQLGTPSTATLTIVDNDQGGVIQFGAAVYAVAEGGTAALTVTRSGANLASGVTVKYAVTGGTAANGGVDFTLAPGTLTFNAGEATKTISVPTVEDTLAEGNETVLVTLSAPTGGATLGPVMMTTTTLTIVDDDQGGVIQFGAAAYTVAEGGPATLTVTRSGVNLASAVTVSYAVTGGTATNGGVDFTLAPGTLTFNAGEATKTISVPTVEDTLAEGNETVIVTLSTPTGGATLGPVMMTTTTLTIVDNDHGGVIQFGATTYSVAENVSGGTATVLVRRTGTNLASGVTVRIASTGGTATPGVHYAAVNRVLTFAAGVASLSVPITILDNAVAEGHHTVGLTLSSPTGRATLGTLVNATLTILDDEQGVRFSAASYSMAEVLGTVTITVQRTGPTAGTARVHYATAAGTATPGTDYNDVSGDLTFTPGQTSKSFAVPVLPDTRADGARTVQLRLSAPGPGLLLGTPGVATLMLTDNDQGGVIQFGADAFTVVEGGTAALTVTRSGANLASGVTVSYAVTGGTAVNGGVDYTLATGTLTFAAAETTKTISVQTVADTLVEDDETVVVALSSPTGGARLGAPMTATLTIVDNDEGGIIQFGAAAYTVTEGGTAALTVTRSGTNLASGVTVSYAVSGGTAVNGVDYTLGLGTLTFAAGETTKTISVPTAVDTLAEDNETVLVTLSNPTSRASLGARATTTLTIVDNDQGGVIQFGAAAYTVTEGGTAALAVKRSGTNLASAVTVRYAVAGGTAVNSGVDYTLAAGTLTFAAGETAKTIGVPTVDDTLVVGNRTVVVALSSPTGEATLGAQTTATLTITDNDQGGLIQFSAATYTVAEGATATLTVTRSGMNLARDVTVTYAATGGTARNAGVDYTLAAGLLTFAAGETSRTIQVPTVADGLAEPSETVIITLSSPTGGATLGAQRTTTLTIQ